MDNQSLDIEDAYILDEEKANLIQESKHCFVKSKFGFLQETNGLRPGMIHILLSTTHAGKSSLIREIVRETSEQGNVFLWLTEEDKKDFRMAFANNFPSDVASKRIKIYSEQDMEKYPKDVFGFVGIIEKKIRAINPHLVVIDNLTTSFIYNDRWDDQHIMVQRLKTMAKFLGCPILIVMHTTGSITKYTKALISPEDIRGKKQICYEAQFFYVLQPFIIGDVIHQTIRIEKHRGYQTKNTIFKLVWDSTRNTYSGDYKISFENFKECFKGSNKL